MRAMAIAAYGGPGQLKARARPRPRPGRGELLLRVVAAGVNPVDCELRSGGLADAFDCRFPLVPGWDAAGVVEELGDGATGFRKGDRVFTSTRRNPLQWGCYAEYVAAPEAHVARMPGKLLFEEAAAVPLAALTARQCLDRAGRSLDGARNRPGGRGYPRTSDRERYRPVARRPRESGRIRPELQRRRRQWGQSILSSRKDSGAHQRDR